MMYYVYSTETWNISLYLTETENLSFRRPNTAQGH